MRPILIVLAALWTPAFAEVVGKVSTTFRMLGTMNDKILVDVFDDPKVNGVSCYVSHAQTGGVKGTIGLATDPSRMSIACRQTGPIHIVSPVDKSLRGEDVFSVSASLIFKELRVTRILDSRRNVLVYLIWSTKLINGSPFNSVTAVPIN